MALISTLINKLRRDPRPLYKVPPYISSLLIFVGVIWLLLLPLNQYSRKTYISENALLPGQVHTYFAGSEQNIFRAYKHELEAVKDEDYSVVSEKLQSIFRESGLKVATQDYEYRSAGNVHSGQNVYSVIQAPRGDGTEAIVIVAAWKTIDDESNIHGVALALTLARYFKRWSLWSKDIIFLITPDSKSGAQAWVDAYHDMQPSSVQSLPLKSGALQGAIVFEYPFSHRFESIHIVYDGVNGQLPNLDLINTAVHISSGQLGIPVDLQQVWAHDNSYKMRLETMLKGMARQGLGQAAGLHSSFMPYHVDAITLQAVGNGWQDELSMGRVVESLVRSLNNLLEHLHQSFFFYLIMHPKRFVSIGTYLPCAMLVAGNFTIMAAGLWAKSGYRATSTDDDEDDGEGDDSASAKKGKSKEEKKKVEQNNGILERHMALPLTLVVGLHFLGIIPLYIFNNLPHQVLSRAAYSFAAMNVLFPILIAVLLVRLNQPTAQQFLLVKSFSLFLLGLMLSALATLNFSLSLFIGLLCSPLTFIGYIEPTTTTSSKSKQVPSKSKSRKHAASPKEAHQPASRPVSMVTIGLLLLNLISPAAILFGLCKAWNIPVETVLIEAAFGWDVWGMWTQVAVWCIWWPAWLTGCLLLVSSVLI